MHVLLIGGGGREHALAWKLLQSPLLRRLSATDDNPGFPSGVFVPEAESDPVRWAAENGVDLVVPGPEAPLAKGIVDALAEAGIPAFGPTKTASLLETSKSFAKAFMVRHGIPTAAWTSHTDAGSAHSALHIPCVIKADGLAAGKGVIVAEDDQTARAAIEAVLGGRFGDAGQKVLIEERLSGPELSVLALCDGEKAIPLLPARDHKRRHDRAQGPNTGGMGAICPPPDISDELLARIHREVLQPAVTGMAEEGHPFRGVLYAGLMLTDAGPRVLEFNVRFGDPECQPLMMMLDEDLLPLLQAAATDRLPDRPLRWKPGAACCVVVVAGGYPGVVESGHPIDGLFEPTEDEAIFFAGARRQGARVVTGGGRVLAVTARGEDVEEARQRAYRRVHDLRFEGADWRTDIGISLNG